MTGLSLIVGMVGTAALVLTTMLVADRWMPAPWATITGVQMAVACRAAWLLWDGR